MYNWDMNQQNEIGHQVSFLLDQCEQKISGRKEMTGTSCGPNSPALFVLLGSSCAEEKASQVKQTIALGWNRLHQYITYLEYPEPIDYSIFLDAAEEKIDSMTYAPEKSAFREFDTIKIYVFLELNDENADAYLNLFDRTNTLGKELERDCQIVLFALFEEKRKTKKMVYPRIRKLMKIKEEDKVAGVVLLSDSLYGGNRTDLFVNYRLAADIAYISNSYDISTMQVSPAGKAMESDIMERGFVTTSSYIQLNKPADAIAETTLRALLENHVKQERESIGPDFDRSKYGFFKKLKSEKRGTFGLEEKYRSIERNMYPLKTIYQFLPYSPQMEKHKGVYNSYAEVMGLLSPEARMVYQLTEQRYFNHPLDEYIKANEAELKEYLKEYLENTISYTELLEYGKDKEQLELIRNELETSAFENIIRSSAPANEPELILWNGSSTGAKEFFYKKMGPLCREVFDAYYEKAQFTAELTSIVLQYLQSSSSLIKTDIGEYYSYQAKNKMNYAVLKDSFLRTFDSIDEWFRNLKKIFERFVDDNRTEWDTTFEQELALRIAGNTADEIIVNLGFSNDKLVKSCRLSWGNLPDGNTYCMVYSGAEFIDELKKIMKPKDNLFMSSRQDSVERLMISKISCSSSCFTGYEEDTDASRE